MLRLSSLDYFVLSCWHNRAQSEETKETKEDGGEFLGKTKKRKNEKTENKLCPSYLLPFRDQSRLIHNMNFGVLAKTVRILVQKSRVHQNFAIQMLTRLLVCLFVVCCLSTFSCKHSSLQSTLTAVTATGCQVRVFCVRL